MNRVEGTMPSARFYFVCAGAKIGGWPCPGVQNRCFLGCGVKAAVMQKHNQSQRVLQANAPLQPRGQECRNQPTIKNKTRACRMGKFALCKPLFYCAGEREQPHPVRPIRGRFRVCFVQHGGCCPGSALWQISRPAKNCWVASPVVELPGSLWSCPVKPKSRLLGGIRQL